MSAVKILRYFFRGLEEVARELGLLKGVVVPKKRSPPSSRDVKSILSFVSDLSGFSDIWIYDGRGSLLVGTSKRGPVESSLLFYLEDSGINLSVLRKGGKWYSVVPHRGFYVVSSSTFMPDVVDLWLLKRYLDRWVWGYLWEG